MVLEAIRSEETMITRPPEHSTRLEYLICREKCWRPEPTDRQAELLSLMRRFLRENGYPPTVRWLASQMGIGSPNGITCHLKALHRKGLIVQGKARASRTWMPVVAPGDCPCCGQPFPPEGGEKP